MKLVYVDVSPADAEAVLTPDTPGTPSYGHGSAETPWKKDFTLPDVSVGGGSLQVMAAGYQPADLRVIIPDAGELLKPPEDGGGPAGPIDLVPVGGGGGGGGDIRLAVEGERFVRNGQTWKWKGSTDFYAPALLDAGQDLRPVLDQRKRCGANLLRSLSMVNWDWTPFWGPIPSRPNYWASVEAYWRLLAEFGLYCEWTVFAGTKGLMPYQSDQLSHWQQTVALAQGYPNVLVELINEYGHPSQLLDPSAFPRPSGVLASHGSGITDAPAVNPYWDFGTYHARRDAPADGRGFVNYDVYAWEPWWPKPCPFVPDEGIKPGGYGFQTSWARQMGRHAGIQAGGTFHHEQGNMSELWPPETEACARAFYAGIDSVVD